MKDVIQFENIAELKSYLTINQLELIKEIPADIIQDDRNSRINLVLNEKGKKEFHVSGNFNNNPPFVIILNLNRVLIDSIDLIKKSST